MENQPPKSLMRPIGRAIGDFDMIRSGDRILLGVSGGKDSLSLLHALLHLRKYSPVAFEVGAVTVDPGVEGFDPGSLRPYIESLSVPYFLERQPLMERAMRHMQKDSYCSWCARMKRGIIYAVARREKYNVTALAQHLDDLAESFLMSAFHAGELRTMKAHYLVDAGDLRVIRPMVYVRERQTRAYAHCVGLPVIRDNCPACFRMPTQRMHMKQLLAVEEADNKLLFKRILSTIRPLMSSGGTPAGS
jgi:tRNA 2-thiocytidine biosynthesis protein TtcA